MEKITYAAGCMSGTSLDGLDVAVVAFEGESVRLLSFSCTPLPVELEQGIRDCFDLSRSNIEAVCSLNHAFSVFTAEIVKAHCARFDFPIEKLDFIASHGQTIWHIPDAGGVYIPSTLQIGDPSVLSYHTGRTVVSGFRNADMAAGGQGAPLVPFADFKLFRTGFGRLMQNIGGIGNVTVLPANCSAADVFAFDTGPGNMIIDALAQRLFGKRYDPDGTLAASGQVLPELLDKLMATPFISAAPPKTTGRELFGAAFVERLLDEAGSANPHDILATATAFTAESIVNNCNQYVFPSVSAREMIVSGGGAYNKTLMRMLSDGLPTLEVKTLEALGMSSDAKEAVAFAVLGYETLNGRPSNMPAVTGAARPVVLGSVTNVWA